MLRTALAAFALMFVASSAIAAPPKLDEAQWKSIFGTKADGPVPTFLKDFRKDMTPGEAGVVMKGAGKPSKFGFAKLAIPKTPGLKKMEIYFAKEKEPKAPPTKLRSITLVLDKSLMKDKAAYDALIAVLSAKYGTMSRTSDVEQYKIIWSLGGGMSASIWKIGKDLTFKFSF